LIVVYVDIAELFCNVEVVQNWSKTFREGAWKQVSSSILIVCAGLEESLGDELTGTFGDLFEEMVSLAEAGFFGWVCGFQIPLLRQLYNQYSENYEQALATYEKLKSSNKKFHSFLERKVEEGGRDLLSYLYLPIQRILAYEALLKVSCLFSCHRELDVYSCFSDAGNSRAYSAGSPWLCASAKQLAAAAWSRDTGKQSRQAAEEYAASWSD
jgi:hypothetical protein